MNKNNLSNTIYTLLDKGCSRDEILNYVATTVGRHINIETIYKVYEITENKWRNKNGKEIYN